MNVKLIGVFIGIAISIIMIGNVLAPVVNDAAAESDNFRNDGYYTLDYNIDNVIEWEQSSQYDLIVNGNVYDLRQLSEYSKDFSIIESTDLFVRATITPTYVRFSSFSGEKGFWDTDSSNAGNYARWEIDNGIITATYSKNSTTGEVVYKQNEKIYTINAEGTGSFVMKESGESVYINSDSSIVILAGITRVGDSADVGIFADGVYNSLDFTLFNAPAFDPVISDVVPTYKTNQNYKNLILLEKFNFDIEITGGTVKEATYDYFVVPTEVSADRVDPLSDGVAGVLIATIPLMIVAVLMMAVILIRSRD